MINSSFCCIKAHLLPATNTDVHFNRDLFHTNQYIIIAHFTSNYSSRTFVHVSDKQYQAIGLVDKVTNMTYFVLCGM